MQHTSGDRVPLVSTAGCFDLSRLHTSHSFAENQFIPNLYSTPEWAPTVLASVADMQKPYCAFWGWMLKVKGLKKNCAKQMGHFWMICKSLTCSDAFRHQCLIAPMGTLYKSPKTWASTRTSTGRVKDSIKSHILNFFNNHNQSIEMGSKFDFQLCRMIAHYWSPSAKKTKGTLPTKEETKNRNCWTKSSSNYWTLHLTLFENPFYIIVWVKMKGIDLLNIWWSLAMISQFGFAKRGLDSGLLPLSPVVWPL